MAKFKFTKPRATLSELLEFCNVVRDAGGGNPLDALIPAVPEDVSQCLIAKNLNFNCGVACTEFRGQTRWVMVTDPLVRDRIADKLGLARINFVANPEDWGQDAYPRQELHGVVLPKAIGAVASAFDDWRIAADIAANHGVNALEDDERERLQTFTPYIDQAVRETYDLGEINKKGELVL